MPELSGIYDADFIQPIAKIKENLSLWTGGGWYHYVVEFEEPMPPSPAMRVDMVAATGATVLAAGGTIQKAIVAVLGIDNFQFLHCRWEPLDNVEGVLWIRGGQARNRIRGNQSRVDKLTRRWDPMLASTTFGILGFDGDMQLEVRNPMGYPTPVARFQFFGHRYILAYHPAVYNSFGAPQLSSDDQKAMVAGDRATVRRIIGPTVFFPAEGRQS